MQKTTEPKKIWELYPDIWKSESAFMSWIRGGIRKALWMRHPVKLEFIKHNRIRIPNPNPRGKVAEVWGATCALTGDTLVIAEMEVDHKEGGHSLRTLSDLSNFVDGIVMITEDDLQFVSKKAHKIKSHAEKMGISFEDAAVEKEAIEILKRPVQEVVAYCAEHGYNDCSNATKRRAAVTQILRSKYD